MKRRKCLRCDRGFGSEGPHNRLCGICNNQLASQQLEYFRIYERAFKRRYNEEKRTV